MSKEKISKEILLPPKPEYSLCNAGHQLVPYYNTYSEKWTWDCPTCIEKMRRAYEETEDHEI